MSNFVIWFAVAGCGSARSGAPRRYDLLGHGDTPACLKQIVSGTSLRKWRPSHTHTHSTRYTLTLSYTYICTQTYACACTHTQQQWQGDQPSSDPRKEARWKRSGSGKGPSKPINKPNMPVSTSQRARNIHSMSFHRAFRLFLCLCVCSFLWCSHI